MEPKISEGIRLFLGILGVRLRVWILVKRCHAPNSLKPKKHSPVPSPMQSRFVAMLPSVTLPNPAFILAA